MAAIFSNVYGCSMNELSVLFITGLDITVLLWAVALSHFQAASFGLLVPFIQ